MMERIVARDNLKKALAQVRRNKGAPGVDGMTVDDLVVGGMVDPMDEGVPQGGPLSPLLSNLMLDGLDKELERRGHRFARYADDCNIYVRSPRAGERVMASVTQFLERRLKLKVNKAKSAVASPTERKFLGFSFLNLGRLRRCIAPQALARFKQRVRELTSRTGGRSLAQIIPALSRYLIGWRGYFGFCETPTDLHLGQMDQATAPCHRLEAVEVWASPLCGTAPPWHRKGLGGTNRR